MNQYFEDEISVARGCGSEIECRVRLVSLTRLLLQQVAYGLLDWISALSPDAALQPNANALRSLRNPTDGSLVDAVEELLICADQLGWSGASRILREALDDQSVAIDICGDQPHDFMGVARAFVDMRNDGAEGHGLIGGYRPDAEAEAVLFLLNCLKPVLPVAKSDDKLAIHPSSEEFSLRFLRSYSGRPILIRRIKPWASDRVRAYCQAIGPDGVRVDFNFDAVSPFEALQGKRLPSLQIWDNSWSPLVYVPSRKTDSFTGRDDQISELTNWFGDDEERRCLVYGDGGLGKTTLALEFIHRVLDEEIKSDWQPGLVIYYTAKRWQFGLNGLEPIGSGSPHLFDLLVHIHSLVFSEHPDRSFYKKTVAEASVFLAQQMAERASLKRANVFIIIDNAETLIRSEEDRATLGKEILEISKRVGKVLLTSRRRELVAATPIPLGDLSQEDAGGFVRDRGVKLRLPLITKAGSDELKEAIDLIERRPLVLEAFVGAAADPVNKTLKAAATAVRAMLRRDLGEFLFADAWARLRPEVRKLLLLMTRVGDVHDSQSLRICALTAGVAIRQAEEALDESGGIASVVNIEGDLNITFSRNFLDYANGKGKAHPDSPSEENIAKAQSDYSRFIQQAQRFTGDRIGEAFRTPQAKAAHAARKRGDYKECRKLFDQAILTDSTNPWLFDRFAYFLFHDERDYAAALHYSKKAVDLLPNEGEIWYTKGVIEARLGSFRDCANSMDHAEQLGIEVDRCLIQRCWAYLIARPAQLELALKAIRRLQIILHNEPVGSRRAIEFSRIQSRYQSIRKFRSPS